MELGTNGTASKSVAMVKATPTTSMQAYEPKSSDEAFKMAEHFAKSKLLNDLVNPDAVFLVMAVGAELGIPATAALRGVYVVKGRAFVSADLMKSLCLRRRDICEFFRLVKSDEKAATYTAKRAGDEPVTMTFTMEQAKRAQLVKDGSAWSSYPETMLRHRCVAMIAREVFPDLVMGIHVEEERAEIEQEIRVVEAEVVETKAVDELAQRIEAFGERIDNADSMDTLKAIVAEIGKDPAAKQVKNALGDRYNARREVLNMPDREPGSEG